MLQFEPFLSLLLAFFAGLLIGLERQQHAASNTSRPEILGGVRTHPLVASVGACTLLLTRQTGPGILLGVASNTVVKAGMTAFAGAGALGAALPSFLGFSRCWGQSACSSFGVSETGAAA